MEWWKTIKNVHIQDIEKCVSIYRMESVGFNMPDVYYNIKTYENQNGKYRARTDICYRHKKNGSLITFDVCDMMTEQQALEKLLSLMLEFFEDLSFNDYETDYLPHYRF